ncbi:hypothetical protein D3C81_2013550 [compost metagenome]
MVIAVFLVHKGFHFDPANHIHQVFFKSKIVGVVHNKVKKIAINSFGKPYGCQDNA